MSLILSSLQSISQKSTNWWYFGSNAGLNFNSITAGLPQTLANGSLATTEGCASISDRNGNLLFYTDGRFVWDKNHTIMSNGSGLLGHNSTTQSAIIVPNPGNKDKYYIFTVAQLGRPDGLRWSEVDMGLRVGAGDVISGTKNTLIRTPVCERIAAVKRSIGGYWIVVQISNSNRYAVYSVTTAGISTTPVITSIGPVPNSSGVGSLKFSAEGDQLAVGYVGFGKTGKTLLFDFNAANGTLSNLRMDSVQSTYGIEFSPDGSKLYAADLGTDTIRQYEVNSTNSASFMASMHPLAVTGIFASAIQVGPDKKIYVANHLRNQLGVIHDPNKKGVACNLSAAGPVLPGSALSQSGLPTFVQSFFIPTSIYMSNACVGNWVIISVKDTTSIDSVHYIYGDTASSKNSSWNKLDSHIFSSPGKYEVIAYTYSTDAVGKILLDTLTEIAEVLEAPVVELPEDSLVCLGDTIFGLVTNSAFSSPFLRMWQDSSQDHYFKTNKAGKYFMTATNRCGVGSDTVIIDPLIKQNLFLGNDTFMCKGDSLLINLSISRYNFIWSDGSSNNSLKIYHAGKYWVQIRNHCSVESDTILIDSLFNIVFDLGKDTTICAGESMVLDPMVEADTYAWNNGSNQQLQTVEKAGKYSVTASNACGSWTDEVKISMQPLPEINLPSDTFNCGDSMVYNYAHTNYSFLWPDGSSSNKYEVVDAGEFEVEMWDNYGCYNIMRFDVKECPNRLWVPNAFSPNNDGINDRFLVFKEEVYNFEIEIYDRWNKVVYSSNDIAEGWNGTVNNNSQSVCPGGVYIWKIRHYKGENSLAPTEIGEVVLVR